MVEKSQAPVAESANWLTLYPTDNAGDRLKLVSWSKQLGSLPDTKDVVLAVADALDNHNWQGHPLSPDEIRLLQKVYTFITDGIALGVDEGVSLKLRRLTDATRKTRAEVKADRNEVEVWSFYSGDYRGQTIGESIIDRQKYPLMSHYTGDSEELNSHDYVPHLKPGDRVHLLAHRIKELLSTKTTGPVVIVDIGAMYGTTLIELADVYRNEIEKGRLLLIATNIGLNRKVIEETRKPQNGNPLYQNYDDLYQRAGHLVHFLSTDVEGLIGRTIELPNGNTTTLTPGSVDLIHESWSISVHSGSLEQDVADLLQLVGESGVIMSNHGDPKRGASGLSPTEAKASISYSGLGTMLNLSEAKNYDLYHELDAFKMRFPDYEIRERAHQTMVNHGLQLIEQVTDPDDHLQHRLNYSFYVGKNSAPLTIFNEKGTKITLEGGASKPPNRLRRIVDSIFRKSV